MIKPQYDIGVVGAGPSGAVLAFELARKGVKVLLLEKEKLPRPKICAGGITHRASTLLPFEFSKLVENVIYGASLSYNLVHQRTRRYEQPLAYMVKRDKFDYWLDLQAVQAGAILQEGVEVRGVEVETRQVRVRTNYDSYTLPLLVGADGANSLVMRSLGLKKGFKYGLGVNSYIEVQADRLREWDGLIGLDWGIPGGYAWVFPKNGYLSVGAGSSLRIARNLKPYTLRMIQKFGLSSRTNHVVKGHLMPLRRPGTPLSSGRVLLVGDAAGVIDPLSGEGIFYGLKSSYLALEAIMQFLEGKASGLSGYDRAVDKELMPELRTARTIQKMNSLTPQIFFHYLKENDRFWRAFCRMLRGEKTYLSLKASLPAPLRALFKVF